MFCKSSQPGYAKTRWGAVIGYELAARASALFQATLARRFGRMADVRTMMYTPGERRAEFEALAGGEWRLCPQVAGDLGQRLTSAANQLARDGERLVFIGSDSPDLPASYLITAFATLQSQDVVIGPSSDGGYYLIGMRTAYHSIFAGIPWSTPQVLDATRCRLREAGIGFELLPEWYDVDDETGWQRFIGGLGRPDSEIPAELEAEYRRIELAIRTGGAGNA
jgi:rSAM/selenodomain-associated transferase 1